MRNSCGFGMQPGGDVPGCGVAEGLRRHVPELPDDVSLRVTHQPHDDFSPSGLLARVDVVERENRVRLKLRNRGPGPQVQDVHDSALRFTLPFQRLVGMFELQKPTAIPD